MRFGLKKIHYFGRDVSIVLQNENGPCPLIALANVLSLQGRINIHPDLGSIEVDELISQIADCLLEKTHDLNNKNTISQEQTTAYETKKQNQESSSQAARQAQLNDVLSLLPSLVQGLDLNVRFAGVSKFEFTRELSVFDALNVPVYHGWVADPTDEEVYLVVRDQSYNQLTNKLVEVDAASTKALELREDLKHEGAIVDQFLTDSASQLTQTGLNQLHAAVADRQLAVFFRNNHFATLLSYDARLFLLVTDQGYSKVRDVVWELLDTVRGSSDFVDSSFAPFLGVSANDEGAPTVTSHSADSAISVPAPVQGTINQHPRDETHELRQELDKLLRDAEAGRPVDQDRLGFLLDYVPTLSTPGAGSGVGEVVEGSGRKKVGDEPDEKTELPTQSHPPTAQTGEPPTAEVDEDTDAAFARMLQEEEEDLVAIMRRQDEAIRKMEAKREKKKNSACILC